MIDDEIRELLDISNKVDESFKDSERAKGIQKKARENDSLNEYLSEREPGFEMASKYEKTATTNEAFDLKENRIEFSIKEYVEMATTGYPSSIEESIKALFIDKQTIVHCTDNNINYSFQEILDLIDFIKSNTNEKQN